MISVRIFERFVPSSPTEWKRTVVAGLVGGIIFGVIIQFWLDKMAGLGLLYGSRSLVLGWISHLFYSIVGAFIFRGVISQKSVNQYLSKPSHRIVLGLIYGFILWAALTSIILPIWFRVVAPWPGGPLQNFTNFQLLGSLIGFLVYGSIVVGSVQIKRSHKDKENTDSISSEENNQTDDEFEWENEK